MKRILASLFSAIILAFLLALPVWPFPIGSVTIERAPYTQKEAKAVQFSPTECYHRAALYLLKHADEGGRLVHGTAELNGIVVGHAWVLLPGERVFDGAFQQFYKKASYSAAMKISEERVYKFREMTDLIARCATYGPWHATKGLLLASPVVC